MTGKLMVMQRGFGCVDPAMVPLHYMLLCDSALRNEVYEQSIPKIDDHHPELVEGYRTRRIEEQILKTRLHLVFSSTYFFGLMGSVSVNVDPFPSVLLNVRSASSFRAMTREECRPSPAPFASIFRAFSARYILSKMRSCSA